MFPPFNVDTERARIRTEREYREWQQSLRSLVPPRRRRNGVSFLARLVGRLRRTPSRAPQGSVTPSPC
jgi:hypothetical protein